MRYSSSTFPYDKIYSLELVYLYVNDYKSLKKLHINLNPKFITWRHDDILYIKDAEHYIRKEEFSNVKLICGENGVGKTSLLELIRDPHRSEGTILVLKTNSNEFISNAKIKINYNDEIYNCNNDGFILRDISSSQLCLGKRYIYGDYFDFNICVVDFYIKNKGLFNDIDENLLTHFEITNWEGDELIDIMLDSIRRNLRIPDIYSEDLDSLREKDILSYLFYRHFGDRTFANWIHKNKKLIDNILGKKNENNTIDILIRIRKIFYNPRPKYKIYRIIDKLKEIIGKEFSLEEYQSTFEKFKELSDEFDKIMKKPHQENDVCQYEGVIHSLFYFCGFKKVEDEKIYIDSLSSGEFISIRNRCNLYMRMIQSNSEETLKDEPDLNSIIILEDEPDLHLHPEWSRIFIKNYFDTVSRVREYLVEKFGDKFRTKIYNFVMTTHSPLILSDFFKEEVIFFQKKNGEVSIRKTEEISDCFAGNIGDMLIDNFFLSKTIGEYSEEKINDIIKRMDNGKTLSDKEKKDIEFIISHIGDKLLKRLLEEKFNRVCKRSINENN